jgi:hypothetical protein
MNPYSFSDGGPSSLSFPSQLPKPPYGVSPDQLSNAYPPNAAASSGGLQNLSMSGPTSAAPGSSASPAPHSQQTDSSQQSNTDAASPGAFISTENQTLEDFLEGFWSRQMMGVEDDDQDVRNWPLPLARIKKVMKSDEDVKMISAEGALLLVH